jgi:hypothetical protein
MAVIQQRADDPLMSSRQEQPALDLHSQLNAVQLAVRAEVCTSCSRRPCTDHPVAVAEPLGCEATCDLIAYLPRLIDLVNRYRNELPDGYEAALQNLPCRQCASPHCDESACHESRPLDVYALEVMGIVERIARALRSVPAR